MTIKELLSTKKATPEACLSIYDQLEPVSLDFMLGQWKGFEITTGHPMEGLLEASGWYGKIFLDRENVHPLLMYSLSKKRLFSLNPFLVPLGINLPKSPLLKYVIALSKTLLKTNNSKARMRLIEYRNKVTGTMAYDAKGIFDHFAKIDEQSMLGVMDLKGSDRPYFFVLERARDPQFRG